MLSITWRNSIDPKEVELRNAALEVAATKTPIKPISRPPDLPTVSILYLVKNEWVTMIDSVSSLVPLGTEIIIGIDTETDSLEAMAFFDASRRKTEDECREYFSRPDRIFEQVTIADIAEFVGHEPAIYRDYLQRTYLTNGKPTEIAAKKCLEIVGAGKIIPIDFNNHFSNARNELLAHCTGDYVFMVDGHEFLNDPHKMVIAFQQALLEEPGFLRMGVAIDMQDSPAKEVNIQCRLFKRTPEAHYERGVHNQLIVGNPDERVPSVWSVKLVHQRPAFLQYLRTPQRSQMTTDHMGAMEDHHSAYYMALAHHKAKSYQEAVDCYMKYLELNPKGIEAAYVCAMAGVLLNDHLDQQDAAVDMFSRGIATDVNSAFNYLALAEHYIRKGDDEPDTLRKEEYYKKGLSFATHADLCEMPKSSIALPQVAYTWEPSVRMAECLARLGNPERAVATLMEAKASASPDIAEELEKHAKEIAAVHYTLKSDELKQARAEGRKTIYIVDGMYPNNVFSEQVERVADYVGMHVIRDNTLNVNRMLSSDVVWVDWHDQSAELASRIYRNDRKVYVRTHAYETFAPVSNVIYDNLDMLYVDGWLVGRKMVEKFGCPADKVRLLPYVPYPFSFTNCVDPNNMDVVMLKYINHKNGYQHLPDIAKRCPEFTFHVGGTVQEERIYDEIVYRCAHEGIYNIVFYGNIGDNEKVTHFSRGSRYLILSSFEGDNVSIKEAKLCGLQTFAMSHEWNHGNDHLIIGKGLDEMVSLLKTTPYEVPDTEYIFKLYESTSEEVLRAITA